MNVHCSFGMTTSRARIAAPNSQFTTMSRRNAAHATGKAEDCLVGTLAKSSYR